MIPQIAVDLIKEFEGFHRVVQWKPVPMAVPYVCPAGYWTIGYGILCRKDHPAITLEQGEAMLAAVLPRYAADAIRLSPGLIMASDSRLSAIISFVFNLGASRYAASTLRKRINEGDWDDAVHEIQRWVYGGGRKLPGLIRRRAAEAELLMVE